MRRTDSALEKQTLSSRRLTHGAPDERCSGGEDIYTDLDHVFEDDRNEEPKPTALELKPWNMESKSKTSQQLKLRTSKTYNFVFPA